MSFSQAILISGQMVVAAGIMIPHKSRADTGLQAFYQSKGFMVGNSLLPSSSGFITPCTVEKVPFSRGFSNFLDSIVCPPVPSGSGQKL